MALTIAIEGKGVIANCDALTNDTGGTGTGDWTAQGGGSMSLTTDVYLFGTNSIAGKYASKSGFQQFDLGAGNELDFDTAGTEEGQFIYMWINLSTFGVLETLANNGLAIRVSSDSPGETNYKDFTIAGSDGANGWTGGWKLFVIDPTLTASTSAGTCDVGAIRTLGVWIDTVASVRAESLFIDQIAVGTGIRAHGTSTVLWKDIVDYCTDYTNRAWGMWQERDGVYYTYGKTIIGTSTGGTAVSDSGRVVVFADSEYYVSSAWAGTVPADFSGISMDDGPSGAWATSITDGVVVGSDNGRSGSTFIGSVTTDTALDLFDGATGGSATKLYGTSIRGMVGGITWASGNTANCLCYGVSFSGCAQIDPQSGIEFRNCTFAETVALAVSGQHDSALLWNSNMDIQNCKFIANTDVTEDPHAIEFGTAGTYSFTDMLFSGNDYDIENSIDALVLDSYSEANQDSSYALDANSYTAVGQTVDSGVTGGDIISSARFYLQKVGSPTGTIVSKLYLISGGHGFNGIPTGAAVVESKTIDVTTLSASYTVVKFDFPGYTTDSQDQYYCITVEYTNGDVTNYINVGRDGTLPGHGGNVATYSGSWGATQVYDLCFYLDYDGLVTINATDSDPTTHEETGTPKGTTNIVTSVDLTMTVTDADGPVATAYAYIDDNNLTPFIMNTTTNASGIATVSHGGGAVTGSTWRIRKYGYKPYYATVDIGSSNINLPVTLIKDPQQT